MPQLSYGFTQPAGFEGMVSSASPSDTEVGISEETGNLPVGRLLIRGVNQDGVKLPTATTDLVIGVGYHDHALHYAYDPTQVGSYLVEPKAPINVMLFGRLYMITEDAVTPTSQVYGRMVANGGFTALGRVRGSTNTGAIALKGFRFTQAAGAGALVEVALNIATNRALALP
jgi:hypothetical protein